MISLSSLLRFRSNACMRGVVSVLFVSDQQADLKPFEVKKPALKNKFLASSTLIEF